jgi:bacterial leucyl aminopeptidase
MQHSQPFIHSLSSSPSTSSLIHSINGNLSTKNLQSNLEILTNFTTRYYNSDTGRDSMKVIMGKVEGYIKEYGYYEDMKDANGVSYSVGVREFVHPWKQGSIVSL